MRAAHTDWQATELTKEDRRNQVILDTALTYAELDKVLSQLKLVGEQSQSSARLEDVTRQRVAAGVDSAVERWATAHADMHWCNVTAPVCCILDWEAWGLAPRGFDAATLYCASLPVPDGTTMPSTVTASTLAHLLGARTGRLRARTGRPGRACR